MLVERYAQQGMIATHPLVHRSESFLDSVCVRAVSTFGGFAALPTLPHFKLRYYTSLVL